MKLVACCAFAVGVAGAGIAGVQGCSSSSSGVAASDGSDRIIACPPATDASIAEAADAGLVVTIQSPTNGQTFSTSDKISFRGTASDPEESNITDPTRMIWNIGKVGQGVNPDGEGPQDTGGPYPAGSYVLRFDVSTKSCVTGAASVNITVQ